MTGEGNSDETDHVISFLKGGDVTQIDQDKWGVYLDRNKISNVKLKQESPSPQPTTAGSPNSNTKSLNRRVPPPPVRMVTRGVSGAVRPKSVDEILSSLDQKDLLASSGTKTAFTHPQQPRPAVRKTVGLTNAAYNDTKTPNTSTLVYNGIKLSSNSPKNEYEGIDLYAWKLHATHFPLYKQLQTARKTLTTHDWMLARDELKSVKTIQKIEALKKTNSWSLRQLKRHKAPSRLKTHWDLMIEEMKWMHTDFKEERKWKMAMAYITARAVLEWHHTDDKATVCVKTRIPEPKSLPTTPMADDLPTTPISKNSPSSIIAGQDVCTSPITEQHLSTSPIVNDEKSIPVSPEALIPVPVSGDSTQKMETVDQDTTPIISHTIADEPELMEDTITATASEEPLKSDAMMGASNDTLELLPGSTVEEEMEPIAEEAVSIPTTPPIAPAALSPNVIQEYRDLFANSDPNMPIVTLSIEDMGEFDASALFPELLTFGPPDPLFEDTYFNELEYSRITPISKLIAKQINLKAPQRYSRKRDIDGNPIIIYDDNKDDIKQLPRHERYDSTPLISPLFAHKRNRDLPAQQPSTPQPPSNFQHASTHWSEDDDVCLISFIIEYSFNWDLICDALNAVRVPLTGERRTPWECHDRWKRNNLTSLSGQVSSAYTSKLKRELQRRPATIRFDSPHKRQRQHNIFEAIKKTQKKREEAENSLQPPLPLLVLQLRCTVQTAPANVCHQQWK
ncbi:unnamed protein product [Mucor fragilis]